LDQEADLWAVSANGFPFGVVEVKRPNLNGSSIMNNPGMLGQLLDYMKLTQSFYGLVDVYGIFTDYNEWRIVWISEGLGDRELYCSPVYSRISKELPKAVVTFLCKISEQTSNVNVGNVKLWDDARPYVQLSNDGWLWSVKPQNTNLSLIPPNCRSEKFFLLRDYYGGTDGKVWLAASQQGNLCVLKFLKDVTVEDTQTLVEKEVAMWHKMGIMETFACELNKTWAIVMPYAFHCMKNDDGGDAKCCLTLNKWYARDITVLHEEELEIAHYKEVAEIVQGLVPSEVLHDAIMSFAKKMLVQEDVEWRHVAVIPKFKKGEFVKLIPSFIDLGRVALSETFEEAYALMTNHNLL